MIISASRRTDIPAFHAEWFFRRLREGVSLDPDFDPAASVVDTLCRSFKPVQMGLW